MSESEQVAPIYHTFLVLRIEKRGGDDLKEFFLQSAHIEPLFSAANVTYAQRFLQIFAFQLELTKRILDEMIPILMLISFSNHLLLEKNIKGIFGSSVHCRRGWTNRGDIRLNFP